MDYQVWTGRQIRNMSFKTSNLAWKINSTSNQIVFNYDLFLLRKTNDQLRFRFFRKRLGQSWHAFLFQLLKLHVRTDETSIEGKKHTTRKLFLGRVQTSFNILEFWKVEMSVRRKCSSFCYCIAGWPKIPNIQFLCVLKSLNKQEVVKPDAQFGQRDGKCSWFSSMITVRLKCYNFSMIPLVATFKNSIYDTENKCHCIHIWTG